MNVTDKLADKLMEAQVLIEQYQGHQVKVVLKRLEELREEIIQEIRKIDPTEPTRRIYQEKRLEKLQKIVDEMIESVYGDMYREHRRDLEDLAVVIHHDTVNRINESVGVDLARSYSLELFRAIVRENYFDGLSDKEWWNAEAQNQARKIRQEIRRGMVRGEDIRSIVARLKPEQGWAKGARRNVEALVRTQVNQVLNQVRVETYKRNSDLFGEVEHLSTLDSRTSIICIARDGLRWKFPEMTPIGHKVSYETPPLHFRCRSTIIPVLKSYSELFGGPDPVMDPEILDRNLREQVKRMPGESREKYEARLNIFKKGFRSSIDGPVTGDRTMAAFLRRDPGRARKMLGKTRFELFMSGRIKLKDLLNSSGRILNLKELDKRLRG